MTDNTTKDKNYERAMKEALTILKKRSKEKIPCIPYSELVDAIPSKSFIPYGKGFHDFLNELSTREHSDGRPLLSALVVSKSGSTPGEGFWDLADSLGFRYDDPIAFWREQVTQICNYPYEGVPIYRKSWSNATCINSGCHLAIAKMESLLKRARKVDAKLAKKLSAAMDQYRGLPQTWCPKLCAKFISVAKEVVFLEAPEYIYNQFFRAVINHWNVGLEADKEKADNDEKYPRVFTTQKLLPVWIEELKDVQKQALRAYMGILRVLDVCYDDGFDQAVKAFVQHVRSVMTREDVVFSGWIAFHFIREVLNPLIKLNLNMALKHTASAAALLDLAVRLDPAEAMCNDGQPALLAMHELVSHVNDSLHFLRKQNEKFPEVFTDSYKDAYNNVRETLDGLWQIMDSSGKSYMEEPYSELMNLLGEPMSHPHPGKALDYQGARHDYESDSSLRVKKVARSPKRGKREPHDPLKDQQLCDDWKASGMSGKDFCKKRNISHQDFMRLCDRTRARRRT